MLTYIVLNGSCTCVPKSVTLEGSHRCLVTLVDGSSVSADVDTSIERFAVNIYLVLTGARLAYRSDIPGEMNDVAIKEAVRLTGDLLLVIGEVEPLIMLRSGVPTLSRMVKEQPNVECLLALILGYRYVGDDYHKGERYMLHLNYGDCGNLCSYVVPKKGYTQELLDQVKEDELKFTLALEPLGLGNVTTGIWHKQ